MNSPAVVMTSLDPTRPFIQTKKYGVEMRSQTFLYVPIT
jgi:hypothetical protein